jgi:hypothetical protein
MRTAPCMSAFFRTAPSSAAPLRRARPIAARVRLAPARLALVRSAPASCGVIKGLPKRPSRSSVSRQHEGPHWIGRGRICVGRHGELRDDQGVIEQVEPCRLGILPNLNLDQNGAIRVGLLQAVRGAFGHSFYTINTHGNWGKGRSESVDTASQRMIQIDRMLKVRASQSLRDSDAWQRG